MAMLSFRVDDDDTATAQQWAERLRIDWSELLREALHSSSRATPSPTASAWSWSRR
jgi:antitoxin component of RelBE/YafQ-DinJ toxin-antitoxin module